MGGYLAVLWQPAEFIIIFGASFGAYVVSNDAHTLSATPGAMKMAVSGPDFSKDDYKELLVLLFTLFKMMKTKGMLALEPHLEKPKESIVFKKFPNFISNKHAMEFLVDYLRMLTMGSENPHQMDDIIEKEIETIEAEKNHLSHAVQNMADGMPALGIVAAVLGVIHTMGSITEPPEVLGHLIGGALVGTFAGVLMSYGFVAPLASSIAGAYASDMKYYKCMHVGIIAYLNGYAPIIAVEYARKSLDTDIRPSFAELEKTVMSL